MSDNNLINNENDPDAKWMKELDTNIIKHPDGREFTVTMPNWHWEAFNWILDQAKTPLYKIIDAIEDAIDENTSFDDNLMMYIQLYIDRWAETTEDAKAKDQ